MLYTLLIFVAIVTTSISIYLFIRIQRLRKTEISVSEELTIEEILRSDIPDYKKGIALNNFLHGHWLIWKELRKILEKKPQSIFPDIPNVGKIIREAYPRINDNHPLQGKFFTLKNISKLFGEEAERIEEETDIPRRITQQQPSFYDKNIIEEPII